MPGYACPGRRRGSLSPGLSPWEQPLYGSARYCVILGRHISFPQALIKYVRLSYDEDGEIVPSKFMTDFGLEPWDENFRESEFFTDRGSVCSPFLRASHLRIRSCRNTRSKLVGR